MNEYRPLEIAAMQKSTELMRRSVQTVGRIAYGPDAQCAQPLTVTIGVWPRGEERYFTTVAYQHLDDFEEPKAAGIGIRFWKRRINDQDFHELSPYADANVHAS